jgi:acylphosphatase
LSGPIVTTTRAPTRSRRGNARIALVICRRVIVHGRVQGVGFRVGVARAARTRRLAGWVRNRPDGTVEAVFEGDDDAVASLVRFCHEGPRGADVARVEVFEVEPAGATSFVVR